MQSQVEAVFSLSKAEKLQLVEDLWDDIAANPDDIPVHEWQKEELDRRKNNLAENPQSALTWEEIVRRVRAKNGG
ncbi:MAG TPA: addiction module protein [Gemmata sp.]|nr:addiction module protein [Gemmata sp.]